MKPARADDVATRSQNRALRALEVIVHSETALPKSVALPSDFRSFYAEHCSGVLAFFASRTLDPEIATDLTAEAFAEALLVRAKFRGSTGSEAAAWLYAIARHKLSHWARRGVVERRAIERLAMQVPIVSADDRERIVELAGLHAARAAVAEHFARLSAEQQEAVTLRVIQELSYPEIAEKLEVSEQTARARVSRGLRTLALALDPNGTSTETP